MNARIAQLLARYAAKGFAVLLGYFGAKLSDGQIDSIAGPIAAGLGVAAGIVVDLLLHKWQERFKISTQQ